MKLKIILFVFIAFVFGLLTGFIIFHKKCEFYGVSRLGIMPAVGNPIYITWENWYQKQGSEEDVVFIFNGEKMGKGREGFLNIIKKLKSLPKNSIIFVYPDYPLNILGYYGPGGDVIDFPIKDLPEQLDKVGKDYKLRIILSPFDYLGRVHPQLKANWDDNLKLALEREEEKKKESKHYDANEMAPKQQN